ncbi:MAG: hypothetical protein GY947_03420 [Rhodobacteraceae bacterium]|nr:hypothetical protein [Paracoccaceae bacterium]
MKSQSIQPVQIGKYKVGPGHSPLILPDIDLFFNGNLDVARGLINAVKDAGLGVIKAAILEDASVAFDNGSTETYLRNDGTPETVNYRALLEKKALSRAQHLELFDMIRSSGLDLVVSVYDRNGVDLALEQGVIALKFSSSNLTHRPLIEYAVHSGLPLIMDTGKSTLSEIARSVDWVMTCGGGDRLVLEHSPLAPPAPVERQDLVWIEQLRSRFGVPVGLSDHYRGNLMMLGSVQLGAAIIEVGLCRDNEPSDQDVYHALPVGELKNTVDQIDLLFRAMGSVSDEPRQPFITHRGRMSLRALRDISAGEAINLENTAFSFPPVGIGAELWNDVEGCILVAPVLAGQPIRTEDLAPVQIGNGSVAGSSPT